MPSGTQYYSNQVKSSTFHPLKHKIHVAVIYTSLCMQEVYLQEIYTCFLQSTKNRAHNV